MKNKRLFFKDNKGLTLAELVVILAILAVISMILIPTLTGYIDEARAKKYLPNAKSCFDAAQAMFSKQYGLNESSSSLHGVIADPRVESTSGNLDQDITDSKFAADVLKLAGLPEGSPYFFMVGCGSTLDANGTVRDSHKVTEKDKYTVYYAVYIEESNSRAWYYYNGNWSTQNPRYKNSSKIYDTNNIIKSGPDKGVRIQYYLISNHTSYTVDSVQNGAMWTWLRNMK